jgi:urease accessory protein
MSTLQAYGGRWHASLTATVALRGSKSQLVASEHFGPLRLQKALWPEGTQTGSPVHLLMLHPPGGIAGGDSLQARFDVQEGANALITTPGAGKWYRSLDEQTQADSKTDPASQEISLTVGANASLEWLPQEVIVHDGAIARSEVSIRLDATAAMMGCEILVLGRKDYGETYQSGEFRQALHLYRADRLIWSDKSFIRTDLMGLDSALKRYHVNGVFWVSAPAEILSKITENDVGELEVTAHNLIEGFGVLGVSRVAPTLLLVRGVAASPEKLRHAFLSIWQKLRPLVLRREAITPRIWNT